MQALGFVKISKKQTLIQILNALGEKKVKLFPRFFYAWVSFLREILE